MSPRKRSNKRILLHDTSSPLGANLAAYLENEGFKVECEQSLDLTVQKATQGWYTQVIWRTSLPLTPEPEKYLIETLLRFPPNLKKILYLDNPDFSDPNLPFSLEHSFKEHHLNTRYIPFSGNPGKDNVLGVIQQQYSENGFNHGLEIRPVEKISTALPALVSCMDFDLDRHLLGYRIDELEDLFHRYFKNQGIVELEQTVWQRNGRVGILVSQHSQDQNDDHCLLVLRNEQPFGPMQPYHQLPGFMSIQSEPLRSPHYSLATYTLDGGPAPHSLTQLRDLHKYGMQDNFERAMRKFFTSRLPDWEKHASVHAQTSDIHECYRKRLNLGQPDEILGKFKMLASISNNPINLDGAQVILKMDSITFDVQRRYIFPDFLKLLEKFLHITQVEQLVPNPGDPHLDNILVDLSDGKTWLTDCSDRGLVPPHWAAVQLEAELRFGIYSSLSLPEQFQLEQALASPTLLFDFSAVPEAMQTSARGIAVIRASESDRHHGLDSKHLQSYLTGLAYLCLSTLLTNCKGEALTPHQASQSFRSLAGLAMLLKNISGLDWFPKAPEKQEKILDFKMIYDKPTGKFMIHDKEIILNGEPKKMLIYCLQHKDGELLLYLDIAKELNEKLDSINIDDQIINMIQVYKGRIDKAIKKRFPGLIFFTPARGEGYNFHNPPIQPHQAKRKHQRQA